MLKKLNSWIENRIESIMLLYDLLIYRLLRNTHRYYFLDNLKLILKLVKTAAIDTVNLEASSICQLKCPVCPTTIGSTKKIIGYGYLKFNDFKRLVDENKEIKKIELSNWGEIFLNPELKYIIEYAFQKNVALSAKNGVNLNTISEEMIQNLVKYRFGCLRVSIDGASSKTYKIYRKGGDFDRVIWNIKRINHYKKKLNSVYPKLEWQFIIFGHNEHELRLANKMANELGMKFLLKLNYAPDYSPIKDERKVKRNTGIRVASRKQFKKKCNRIYLSPCHQLWFSPQINWDGKLLGCCINKEVSFGDVFKDGLRSCLKNEKYVYVKKMLLGKAEPIKDLPCYNCKFYDNSSLMK